MEQGTKFCQSCGMPLTNEVLGTNADGSKNEDYCIYCYKDGNFTNNCTMDEMIEFCAQFVDEVNKGLPQPITKEEYIGQMKMYFPHLKRWRKELTITDYSEFYPRSLVLSDAVVYLTKDISPEGLVNIYKALGIPAKGRVAIKMSTGEGSNPNYLKPELIKNLVFEVNGTIVECNTAYGNGPGDEQDNRDTSANHWKVIERHGFTPTFKVDIMDEEGEMRLPVKDSTHLKYDIVGDHIANYDFMIALNHFKGHPMGGYGGALKNLSIGCASANGKAYIHSSGKMEVLDMAKLWTQEYIGDQDGFLESMAAAAQAVVDYFQKKDGIIYISVMNNMSIDCDCVDHPAPVKLEDYGILASTDPVALDQACVDIINNQQVTTTNDPTDLLNRIHKQHGVHTIEHAEAIGLGSRKYRIINIDNP